MHEHHLDIKTDDGTIYTFITHPEEVGANARVEWYPGVHHGFGFPHRPAYDKPADERHWERLFSLFARNLADV